MQTVIYNHSAVTYVSNINQQFRVLHYSCLNIPLLKKINKSEMIKCHIWNAPLTIIKRIYFISK